MHKTIASSVKLLSRERISQIPFILLYHINNYTPVNSNNWFSPWRGKDARIYLCQLREKNKDSERISTTFPARRHWEKEKRCNSLEYLLLLRVRKRGWCIQAIKEILWTKAAFINLIASVGLKRNPSQWNEQLVVWSHNLQPSMIGQRQFFRFSFGKEAILSELTLPISMGDRDHLPIVSRKRATSQMPEDFCPI